MPSPQLPHGTDRLAAVARLDVMIVEARNQVCQAIDPLWGNVVIADLIAEPRHLLV